MAAFGEKIKDFIKPMLATAVEEAFSSKDWLYELKWDGYRAIAEIRKNKILLYSRNGISLAARFPLVVEALKKIKTEAIIDGEIVLLNEDGKPDFQKLQNYDNSSDYELVYYAFDLLSLKKKNLLQLTLKQRKELLKKLVGRKYPVIYSSHIETKGEQLFKEIMKDDLEGIIAKKKDSLYAPGVRSKFWLKIKNHKSQEAIIIGFTEPRGSRPHFGSILLAQYKNKKLVYVGHAGTGFNLGSLRTLAKKMKALETKRSPLEKSVKANAPVTWLKPKLVCEVSYSELTKDGIMRHPVFKGLRPEKKSKGIKQETERPLPVKKLVKKTKRKKA